jgi:DNA-binding NarL/FixJ family response regulator
VLKLLLADDHQNMRKVIAEIIKTDAGVLLIGDASSFREEIDRSSEFHPDVVLMDVHMGDERQVKLSDLKTGLVDCQLVAMFLWTDEATKLLAKSLGAFMLLDKTKLGSELLPSLKLCAQRCSAHDRVNQDIQVIAD